VRVASGLLECNPDVGSLLLPLLLLLLQGADYDYDWNYNNNGTPSGKPKPGNSNVDYESSKCRKTFWTPTLTTASPPKCACQTGCICRANISTTKVPSYVTGWMSNGASRCVTPVGERTKYELFHQCRPAVTRQLGN
jgi:hypothetical protein